jgi:peroxiredoxin Q/BCP
MKSTPQVGQLIPIFQAQDSKGQPLSPDHLLGHPYVLYFYPKDDTPGCTQQACELRDHQATFNQLDALIIGVSPDTIDSHHKFMKKYALNFMLIPDPFHELCTLFGVWEEKKVFGQTKWGVTRTTFVIDTKGIIRWIEKPVQIEGHAQRVLQALQNLSS